MDEPAKPLIPVMRVFNFFRNLRPLFRTVSNWRAQGEPALQLNLRGIVSASNFHNPMEMLQGILYLWASVFDQTGFVLVDSFLPKLGLQYSLNLHRSVADVKLDTIQNRHLFFLNLGNQRIDCVVHSRSRRVVLCQYESKGVRSNKISKRL